MGGRNHLYIYMIYYCFTKVTLFANKTDFGGFELC
jgi:hypothetical protein